MKHCRPGPEKYLLIGKVFFMFFSSSVIGQFVSWLRVCVQYPGLIAPNHKLDGVKPPPTCTHPPARVRLQHQRYHFCHFILSFCVAECEQGLVISTAENSLSNVPVPFVEPAGTEVSAP